MALINVFTRVFIEKKITDFSWIVTEKIKIVFRDGLNVLQSFERIFDQPTTSLQEEVGFDEKYC